MIWRISLSKVVDIRERLLQKKIDEQTERMGGKSIIDELAAEHEEYRKETEEIIDKWTDNLLEDLIEYNLADQSVEFSRDFVFLSEALASLIFRARGHWHFLQSAADKVIEVEYDDKNDVMMGRWKINSFDDSDTDLTVDYNPFNPYPTSPKDDE